MPVTGFAPSRTRIAPVIVKAETTYGTDAVCAPGTDDLLTYDAPVPWALDVSRIELRPHKSSFTRATDVIAQRFGRMRFKTLWQGSGGAGTININGFKALAAALRGCGIAAGSVAATSVTFSPQTIANLESVTVAVDHSGYQHTLRGAVGNVTMTGNPRQGIDVDFDFQGLYQAPAVNTGGTTWTNWTGGTSRAQPFLNAYGSINNGAIYNAFVFKSFRFDLGAQIEQIDNANDTTGVERLLYIDRNPTLEVVIAQDNYSSATILYPQWYTDLFTSGSTLHIVKFESGSTTGNTTKFNFPTAQLVDVQPQASGGHREVKLMYKIQASTNESEFSWVIT